jgi:hypothetical protein
MVQPKRTSPLTTQEETEMTIGEFLLVFVGGGGIIGGIVTVGGFVYQEWKRKQELKRELLERQLQQLYGPAYLAVSQIKDAFARSDEIKDKSRKHSTGTQNEQIVAPIELAGSHIAETVIPARERLFRILNDNLHLADPDDIEPFITFVRDYDYYRVETTKDMSKIPAGVLFNLREISFCRPELTDCIEQKFRSKQESWRKLCSG